MSFHEALMEIPKACLPLKPSFFLHGLKTWCDFHLHWPRHKAPRGLQMRPTKTLLNYKMVIVLHQGRAVQDNDHLVSDVILP